MAETVYIRGKKLQNLLTENNITQKDFCQMLDIQMSELSKMIHNKRTAPVDVVNNMAELLSVKPDSLINANKETKSTYRKIKTIAGMKWNNNFYKRRLMQCGMYQYELCDRIKRDGSIFYLYANGKSNPSVDTVLEVCKALKCSSKDLVGLTEEEINKAAGEQIFTCHYGASVIKDTVDAETARPDEEDITEDEADVLSKAEICEDNNDTDIWFNSKKYKNFESSNVIDNIETINKNLLAMVTDLGMANSVLLKKMDELMSINIHLSERIDSLEKKTSVKPVSQPVKPYKPNSSTLWGNNTCSEAEMKEIIKSEVKNCTVKEYKDKIYKLAAYMAKKENSISNAILSKSYTQFTKIYGLAPDALKKETGMTCTIDAIYANPLSREIYFNMMCTNASHA